jgi:hypothetical protein
VRRQGPGHEPGGSSPKPLVLGGRSSRSGQGRVGRQAQVIV